MRAPLALLACLGLALSGSGDGAARVAAWLSVVDGRAEVVSGRRVLALACQDDALELAGLAYVESPALSRLELVWRGVASATLDGPAAFELGPEPRLLLTRFQVAELEVRRGTLVLEVADGFRAALHSGAIQLRALACGGFEVLNRGGTRIELTPEGGGPLALAAGQRVRFGARPGPGPTGLAP